ncbi:mercury(II) reductase [bacterium RCC_150]
MREYDLAVIGSGGGAFAAAIHAVQLGKRVLMVERGTIGGTCVNTGCVPSKALLAAAEAKHDGLDASRFPGLSSSTVPMDMSELMAGKRDMLESIRSEKYLDLITYYGWNLIRGDASFAGSPDAPLLDVSFPGGTTTRLRAAQYLVATGSAPWAPPVAGLEDVGYLTSSTAMELGEVPEQLLVIGGGFVALEQAQLFARLGSKVTMLVRSRLASAGEPEASRTLSGVFAEEGIRVVLRAVPESVRRGLGRGLDSEIVVTAHVAGRMQEFTGTHLLVATGRRPVIAGLNLSAVGVETGAQGEIPVDAALATSNPRILAAGDVTGHPEFVYVAAAQGALAVENAFTGDCPAINYRTLPRVAFTSPALASVGMTGREANAAGIACECRVLPLEFVPRALVNRDTRGFIKIVAEKGSGRILGITAVAKDAGDLAAAGVYILEAGMTVEQLGRLWSPYLTMSEGLKIAAQAFATDVTKLSCCAA